MDVCSVFLQVQAHDEDPFTVLRNCDLLSKTVVPCPDGLEVLEVPVLGENYVDFETIADLIKREKKVSKVSTVSRYV